MELWVKPGQGDFSIGLLPYKKSRLSLVCCYSISYRSFSLYLLFKIILYLTLSFFFFRFFDFSVLLICWLVVLLRLVLFVAIFFVCLFSFLFIWFETLKNILVCSTGWSDAHHIRASLASNSQKASCLSFQSSGTAGMSHRSSCSIPFAIHTLVQTSERCCPGEPAVGVEMFTTMLFAIIATGHAWLLRP